MGKNAPANVTEYVAVAALDDTTIITDINCDVPKPATDDCLLVIHAHEPSMKGRRHKLRRSPVRIGRLPDNEIHLDDDSVSRRHARIEGRAGAWYLMDVGSINGTLVNGRMVDGHVRLERDARIKIGRNIIKYLSGDDVETAVLEELYLLSITDGLTGIDNRHRFDQTLAYEITRAKRYRRPLSLLLIDIDHFKAVNDRYGHLTGDHVLQEVAQLLKHAAVNDTVARYGGEEIAIILVETMLEQAEAMAAGLCRAIEAARFSFQGNTVAVTVSIGCAELNPSDAPSELLARADDALYRAKDGGRNRVAT